MSILYVIFAACLAAGVNYCLRKNFEFQKSAQGYLVFYFVCSLGISFLLRDVELKSFSPIMFSTGIVAGTLNFIMMLLVSYSLRLGPSGLTFAFQNSASVLPSLVLFFLFGSTFGFDLSIPMIIGFACIIGGLFLSAWMQKESMSTGREKFLKWCLLVCLVFLIQSVILSLFQWRCLLLPEYTAQSSLVPWKCSMEEEAWFMPGFFLIPAILQALCFGIIERRKVGFHELFLGITGGILNGAATFFLLLATHDAGAHEKAILFPLFAVGVIFICNLWGKILYGEKIYWLGTALCFAGIFVSSYFSV